MKRFYIAALSIAATVFTFTAISCSESNDKTNKKETKVKKSETKSSEEQSKDLVIAFVDMDSVSNNYQYNKDVEAIMKAKQTSAEATLKSKEKSLESRFNAFQQKAAAFQKKAANITSEAQQSALQAEGAQLEKEQASLQKLQEDYQTQQAKLTQDYQELALKHAQEINDTIEAFLIEYSEEKGFDFLLGKSNATGSVLYGKSDYDVTEEVIEALNKRYEKFKK